jgi:hypothetical protein
MIAAVLLGISHWLDTCPACILAGNEVKLCETHLAEEHSVLAQQSRRLRSKDEAERMSALDAVAALTHAHLNAPSERVVDVIASSLEDDSYAVRRHATELLGRPQNADAVLAAMSKAISLAETERKDLDQQESKIRKKAESKLKDKARADLEMDLADCAKKRDVLLAWRAKILDQLALIPDDRAVEIIRGQTPRDLVLGGNEALARLGSLGAMHGVVESIEAWDKKLSEIKKRISDQKDDPKADGNQMTTLGMTRLEFEYQTARLPGMVVFTDVSKTLLERGILPPTMLEGHHQEWREWVEQHPELFPEHLPGVHSPAW